MTLDASLVNICIWRRGVQTRLLGADIRVNFTSEDPGDCLVSGMLSLPWVDLCLYSGRLPILSLTYARGRSGPLWWVLQQWRAGTLVTVPCGEGPND